ncbi:MAG: hypothetical protein LH606_18030 [Cytophagaceae bacterium]|nr:hypothetical protein [Cytophagaceae bacterium]
MARSASAQIQITLPTTRAVFQRDNNNCTSLTIAGNYTRLVDRVEARLVARQGGSTTGWTTIQVDPQGGVFRGSMPVSGGWYNLEVRGLYQDSQVGNVATLERVGVGEVFIVAGQSNAQGLEPTQAGQPESTDDRVTSIDYLNGSNSLAAPPQTRFRENDGGSHPFPARIWGLELGGAGRFAGRPAQCSHPVYQHGLRCHLGE